MSMPMEMSFKCFICKTESRQTILASTNAFGSPDLDLRPPPMKRNTMHWWIQECPVCGYVSSNIDNRTKIKAEFLKTEEYLSCDSMNFSSDLAARFYKYYMINLADRKRDLAFHAVLHAAWACDDAGDTKNAINCRKLAILQLEKRTDKDENLKVQKADLLRRAGLFEELAAEYGGLKFKDEKMQKIIEFQLEKAEQKDSGRYTVADVLRNFD